MKRILLAMILGILLPASFALAQTPVIFRPGPGLNDGTDQGGINSGKDTWAYQGDAGANYGATPYIDVLPISDCNNTHCVGFIQFDVTTLPDIVDSVFVVFTHYPETSYCYSGCYGDFYFARVSQPWDEMTLTYDSQPPHDTAFYGPIPISFPNDFGERAYDITTTYRLWKTGAVPNYGMTIYSTTVACNNAAIAFLVHSSDDTAVSSRPYLRIYGRSSCARWQVTGAPGLSGGEAGFTTAAINHAGVPYVSYSDLSDSNKATVMKFNGSTWNSVGPVGFSAGVTNYNKIAIDTGGVLYVAYSDGFNGNKTTVMKYDGVNWSPLGTSGFSAAGADYTSLAISATDTPYIGFSDYSNARKATVMKFNGSSWVSVGTPGFSSGIVDYTSIALDGSGTPYIAYVDEWNGYKATVLKFDGASWTLVGSVGFSAGVTDYMAIAINNAGVPYVVYSDYANSQKATVMKFDGASWVTVGTAGFSGGAAYGTNIAIDGSGTPYVTYTDYSVSNKVTVMKYDGSAWVPAGTAGFTAGAANFTSIAIDPSGMPYVAYSDYSVSQKATVQQLQTFELNPVTGPGTVCTGSNITLSDATPGGLWSTGSSTIAIGSVSGIVTGLASGSTVVSYTFAPGCYVTAPVTVDPLPATPSPITGPSTICLGNTIGLTDTTTGGSWSSSNTSVATVDALGNVTGLAAGSATINYYLNNSCGTASATHTVTVSVGALAGTINGATHTCAGSSTTLSCTTSGGLWSSSNPSVATVNATTGVASGISAGTVQISYTITGGCVTTGYVDFKVNPIPVAWTLTGGGGYCVGGPGSPLYLSGSSAAVRYQLYRSGVPAIGPVYGNGSVLNFGMFSTSGTYSVIATDTSNGCAASMPGTPVIAVNPLPVSFTVTGGGSYCDGTGGVHIGLSGSTAGISYQLMHGITHVGTPIAGTGLAIDFGLITNDNVYTVIATDPATGCTANMAGTAPVVTLALPNAYIVTGGGSYCAGGTGLHVGLSYSNPGTSYQLLFDGYAIGSPVTGSYAPIDFGLQSVPGTYSVVATSLVSGCTRTMTGSASIAINPLLTPSVTISTGVGDTFCAHTYAVILASAVNGGSSPAFSWSVNGILRPDNASSFAYLPSDGDVVSVTLTSSVPCPTATTASASLSLTVMDRGIPEITLAANPAGPVCQGTLVSFTPSTQYGGIPDISWYVNGVNQGSFPAFSYLPHNNDDVFAMMTSNYYCREADVVASPHIIMSVANPVAPAVSITADPGATIAHGQFVTLSTTVTNGGQDPTYQWYLNNALIPGAKLPTYSSRNFNNGDSVSCQVLSSGICPGETGSSYIIMHVSTVGVASIGTGAGISLVPNPNKGTFTIMGYWGTGSDQVSVEVSEMTGRILYRNQATLINGSINESVQLGNVASGMYLLSLRTPARNEVIRFVVE